MTTRDQIIGVLLAGGQSRRMGGGDKGLLDLGGKPMLAHVIDRLGPQVSQIIINANGDPQRFSQFRLPVVADTMGGFVGPLAGVLAAMQWTAKYAPQATHLVSASADAPFLPGDLVARLSTAAGGHPSAIALAASGGDLHPVIGLWPVTLAGDLQAALEAGVRKVVTWTDRHGTLPVEFPFVEIKGRSVDPFFNANTRQELDEARALLQG